MSDNTQKLSFIEKNGTIIFVRHEFGNRNLEKKKLENYMDFCEKCGRSGHAPSKCWTCSFCKGKGWEYYGHTDEKCFFLHPCVNCGIPGHFSEKCLEKEKKSEKKQGEKKQGEKKQREKKQREECSYCKENKNKYGKSLRYIGHTEKNCFIKNPCEDCGRQGHYAEYCIISVCQGCKGENRKYDGHHDGICAVKCETCRVPRRNHDIRYCQSKSFIPPPTQKIGQEKEKIVEFNADNTCFPALGK